MKTLLQTIASIVSIALLSISAHGQVLVMQPLTTFGTNGDGSLRPGDVICLTTTGELQRGMAYNPITGHLLVVDRATNGGINYLVYILDGASGANLGTLANISTLGGGNAAFPLNLIGVADDGAIYAANLSNSTTGTPKLNLYRWASESDTSPVNVSPTAGFPSDDPSNGATDASQKRWGDTMTVRGSGLGTQILLANRGTLAALYTPDDGTYAHFTPKTLTTDVATGQLGYGLTFGGGDTFWGTDGAFGNGPLIHLSFNAGAGTATTLTNIPTTRVPGTLTPILVMTASNLLAGITMVPGADVVRLYDITDTNFPVLLDRKSFITTSNNLAFGGALALGTNGVLYALDSDNGIMAFTLATVGSNPLPPQFFLNPANQTAIVGTNVTFTSGADSTLPINYQWLLFGTNFNSSATNANLTLTNVQLTNSGNYSVIASNSAGSVTSSVAILTVTTNTSGAETWNLAGGGTWASTGNWNPGAVPNAQGANAHFNNAASALNPAQTNSSTVTLDGSKMVGSINFSNNAVNAFSYTIANGTVGPLIFNETNPGPASITVNSITGATGNNTISATTSFSNTVVAIVNNITASSAAGALNLTAAISGPGGFTKQGDGLATFGTGAKSYTGPTLLSGGRLRMSSAAQASQTSSFTIAGGQLDIITAGANLTLGSGPLNLNGAGPTTGPFAAFPGAIRNDTGLAVTFNNLVVLQSDTLIHVQGLAAGSTTLAGSVSGPGKLTFTGIPHNADLGTLVLNSANTYTGGTVIDGGTLDVSGASATLGTGDVIVHSANLSFAGSSAKLKIESGVVDAIADSATLSLAGGAAAGVADDGYVDLGAGVNETVGVLLLGGVAQAPGTYGSSGSPATFQNDEFFAGTGVITVPPRPVMTISSSTTNIVVSWPTNAAVYGLQSTTNLVPPITWAPVTNSTSIDGTNKTLTLTNNTGQKFFRLKR